MTWPKRRRRWLPALLLLLGLAPDSSSGQQKPVPYVPPDSIDDPRVDLIRRITPAWLARTGPRRQVVDQVCLVPDLPSFLQAVSSWDEGHYFPILFDDVESSFRFIRAFRPARIVRMPKSAEPIPKAETWNKAVEAVGASWVDERKVTAYRPRGDEVPKGFGLTEPGLVFSSPDASMLAGAVALAAGRFQPLVRVDYPKKFDDLLTIAETDAFAVNLTDKVKQQVATYDHLGDECDFLTIAGDWPFAYNGDNSQRAAVDDRIGRLADPPHRWAYTGRLLGNAKDSTYRAMCSLFLQPEAALMFNGYEEDHVPWSDFEMRKPTAKLNRTLRTSHVSGGGIANLEGWHEAFDPINRFGLVVMNSSGSPSAFNLYGSTGGTSDVPFTIPTAVLTIHSYSAANPNDPDTIAGRWLANGAFIYYGSINEPFLHAFRTPGLVADVIAAHLPLVIAVRATLAEISGTPWRLVFLGDPLYRIKPPSEARAPRLSAWEPVESWPAYLEPARPSSGTDSERFLWAFKTAVARLQGNPSKGTEGEDLVETLLSVDRSKLPADFKPIDDALLTDVLIHLKKKRALKGKLLEIPESERSPEVKRTLGTLMAMDLSLAVARKDSAGARSLWRELMRSRFAEELKELSTARVGKLAVTPVQREEWANLLRSALRAKLKAPEAKAITDELKRVEAELKAAR